ncbi:MAG: acyltransferase [Pyrinomonadaceae bacterium]|nr:acyltransferase [Pyrinomonadaceae bacterium]
MSENLEKNDLIRRIPEIDGLRGLAILGVLAFHLFGEGIDYEQSHWLINYLAEISKWASNGVILFFVISGFLIGGILIDNCDSPNYFKTFYLRRIFRIFPLYYGLIFSFYGLTFLSAHQIFVLPDWLIGFTFSGKWYLTFTQNFAMARDNSIGVSALAPTWSLAVEEQFYLTLPFIIRFVSRKYLIFVIVTLILIAPLFRWFILYQTANLAATRWLMPSCLDALMMGVLIAILVRSKRCYEVILKYRHWLGLLSLLPFLLVLAFIIATNDNFLVFSSKAVILGLTPLSFIFGYLLILAVISKSESLLSRMLCDRFLRKAGELSYFIYLFHVGIHLFVHWQMGITNKPPFGIVWFIEISLTLLITLVLAQLSFKYFEKPLINYGHKFKYLN